MDSLPRKYVTTLFQSTDPKLTARIGIVYYSLARKKLHKNKRKTKQIQRNRYKGRLQITIRVENRQKQFGWPL